MWSHKPVWIQFVVRPSSLCKYSFKKYEHIKEKMPDPLTGLASLGHMTWKLMEFLSHKYRNKCFQITSFMVNTHLLPQVLGHTENIFSFYSRWKLFYFQKLNVIRTEERSLRGRNNDSKHRVRTQRQVCDVWADSGPSAPETGAPAADWWGHLHIHQSELCQVGFYGIQIQISQRGREKKMFPLCGGQNPVFNFCP